MTASRKTASPVHGVDETTSKGGKPAVMNMRSHKPGRCTTMLKTQRMQECVDLKHMENSGTIHGAVSGERPGTAMKLQPAVQWGEHEDVVVWVHQHPVKMLAAGKPGQEGRGPPADVRPMCADQASDVGTRVVAELELVANLVGGDMRTEMGHLETQPQVWLVCAGALDDCLSVAKMLTDFLASAKWGEPSGHGRVVGDALRPAHAVGDAGASA